MLGDFAPAVGRNFAILRIQTDDDVSAKGNAGFLQKAGVFHRRRANDDIADAHIEVALDGFQIANAAADLHRNIVTDRA